MARVKQNKINEMVEDLQGITKYYTDILNQNFEKLRKQSVLIDKDICLWFSIFENRNNQRNNELKNNITERLKENSKFKVISQENLDAEFYYIYNHAQIRNAENAAFRLLLFSNCKGVINESELYKYVEFKDGKFCVKDTKFLEDEIKKNINNNNKTK